MANDVLFGIVQDTILPGSVVNGDLPFHRYTATAKGRDGSDYVYRNSIGFAIASERTRDGGSVERERVLRNTYRGGLKNLGVTLDDAKKYFRQTVERLEKGFLYNDMEYELGPSLEIDENGEIVHTDDDIGVWQKLKPGFNGHAWRGRGNESVKLI